MSNDGEFYFNTKTGLVETGRSTSWAHRMGPYATYEEAAKALENASARTNAWDEEDEKEEQD